MKNIKNILYIKNFSQGKNLPSLKKISNDINLTCINSNELCETNMEDVKKIIDPYDLIILGGGQHHLTTPDIFEKYPEISIQIKIVKLISSGDIKNKLLIGICLGCQIIALGFGFNIIPMKNIAIGHDYLDTHTINWEYIAKSKDKYLNKLNYKLLSKSFSFHYDCIEECQKNNINGIDNLIVIAKSINSVPYIVSNINSNIYGFQSHPEICVDSISKVMDLFFGSETKKSDHIKNIYDQNILEQISTHFFDIFINCEN